LSVCDHVYSILSVTAGSKRVMRDVDRKLATAAITLKQRRHDECNRDISTVRNLQGGFRRVIVPFSASKRAKMEKRVRFPKAIDPARVGKYPASCHGGGGFVWDAVLEYRVWCHPERGAPDTSNGNDYYYAFESYPAALRCSQKSPGAEEPLALILQREYIDEPAQGQYAHVKKRRIAEWPVAFLSRPRRTKNTIPDFLSPSAPQNRLDILRGLAKKRS
jgi:hypothetical protein